MPSRKYFMYLRKSSESDEKQKASIPDQEKVLARIAAERGYSLVGEPLRESRSAKYPGRPLFNRMIAAIEAGEAQGVIAFSLDRLARNSVDSGRIISLLTSGKVCEVVTQTNVFTSTGADKLTMGMQFVLAEYYVDNLSEHVRRSVTSRLEAGQWPSKPKIGYQRDPATKNIVPDPARFHLVQDLLRRRLRGDSFRALERLARDEWKLRTPVFGRIGGKPLTASRLYSLFHDPFYAGYMRMKGKLYRGNHLPMIAWEEYEQLQAGFSGPTAPPPRPKFYAYPYRGLIKCGECGHIVTAERKVNRYGYEYLYWHCARRSRVSRKCRQGSVENEALTAQLAQFLGGFAFPDDLLTWVLKKIDELEADQRSNQDQVEARLRNLLDQANARIGRARALCIDGHITPEELEIERQRTESERIKLEEKLHALDSGAKAFEPLRDTILELYEAAFHLEELPDIQKRHVLQRACSNLVLTNGKLLIQAKKPLSHFHGRRSISEMLAVWNDVRNHLLR